MKVDHRERRQMPDTLESLAAEYGLDIDKPTEGYPLTRLMACALLWRTRAERAEADLAAARNDVVLAQADGARWLAELEAAKAERNEFERHADRFAKTITRLGEWAGVARHRPAQEMGDALIAKLEAVTADREQLRAALAELVKRKPHDPNGKKPSGAGKWVTLNLPTEQWDAFRALAKEEKPNDA